MIRSLVVAALLGAFALNAGCGGESLPGEIETPEVPSAPNVQVAVPGQPALPGAATAAGWKAGDAVDVEWNGSWWKAEVMSASGGKYKIHYVGWSAKWDEEVEAKRVRARTDSARAGTEQPVAPAQPPPTPVAQPGPQPGSQAQPAAATTGYHGKDGRKVFSKNDSVDVEWNGSWWQATIMRAHKKKAQVHYVGWGKKWDEVVPWTRVRPRTATSKKGTEAAE